MSEINNIIARAMHLSEKPNRHTHEHHQIVFGLTGHAEFEISGHSGFVQKGIGCIVPSNHTHSFFGNRENRILILDITPNLPLLELETALVGHSLKPLLDSSKYFQYDQHMSNLLASLTEELDAMNDDKAAPNIIGQCLLHCLYRRLRNDISVEEVGNSRDRINLSRIKRFIYGNLSEKIHTADLARLCNLSESHFYQKFRKTIGITPYQYVIDERISIACSMLKETDKPIMEICLTLGFSNQSAFTNLFRKKTGMSPSAYRQKNHH